MDVKKSLRILLKLIKFSLLGLSGLCLFKQFTDPGYHELGAIISSVFLLFVPDILLHGIKTKLTMRMEFAYYLFVFLAVHLGSCLHFYDGLAHFDKIVHFLSGVFSAIIAYYVMVHYNVYSSSRRFRAIFIIAFALAVAGIWEFWEYSCDQILGKYLSGEVQHGLDDTMWDMIMAGLGAILSGFLFVHQRPQKLIAAECIEVLKQAKTPEDLPFEISYIPEKKLVVVSQLNRAERFIVSSAKKGADVAKKGVNVAKNAVGLKTNKKSSKKSSKKVH